MKYALHLVLGFLFTGCSAVGVVASSDPEVKITQAYTLLDSGRALPAERLFKEVIEIAKQKEDKPLEAKGLVGLADLYRTSAHGAMKENLTNYKLSVAKYDEAAAILTEIGYHKRATMAYLGAAWASYVDGKKSQACEYYNKSANAYAKPSASTQDAMNPRMDSQEKPFLKYLAEYKQKDGCR